MHILLQNLTIEKYGLLILIISFTITYLMIPKLIGVIKYKLFMDYPNIRSSHINEIPTLGGVTFYLSLILCFLLIQHYDVENISVNIIASLTVLFVTGLKDDLVILSVKAKVFSQLLAITFLLVSTDLHIENFYNFLGLTETPFWFSIGFSYFVMFSIINAFNLIDGIDGLASMVGILIFSIFGIVFYITQSYFYFLLSVAPAGFLIAFLRYNLSKSKKIFMGDTGSMLTGFLIGVLSLRFLTLNESQLEIINIQPENLFYLVLVILFVMTTDTLRVVIIRLFNKKGLFNPDRNHVHHILIDLGLSHIQSSIILLVYSIFICILFYIINLYLTTESLIVLFSLAVFLSILFLYYLDQNYRIKKYRPKFELVSSISTTIIKIRLKKIVFNIVRIFF